jgi:hypothetical protein
MERRSLTRIAVLVIGLAALAPAATVAQETAPPEMALSTRLPATVGGSPVEIAFSEDLQAQVDARYPGETHPEVEALTARLSEQGLSLADVATVTAYFGPDLGGVIEGSGSRAVTRRPFRMPSPRCTASVSASWSGPSGRWATTLSRF